MIKLNTLQAVDYYLGGALIMLLRPLTFLVGRILRRDHRLQLRGPLFFQKMLGGGSLVIALPALLGLKRQYPQVRFVLITTEGIVPFAESLGIFDQVVAVRLNSVPALLRSSLRAIIAAQQADNYVDLEVHSRLATVFSLLTMARNRISFYVENAFWRRHVSTHLVFFNTYSGAYHFYDHIGRWLGAEPASMDEVRDHLFAHLNIPPRDPGTLVVAPGCSEFARERMLRPEHWLRVFKRCFRPDRHSRILLLGSKDDVADADAIIDCVRPFYPDLEFVNHCGRLALVQSLRILGAAGEFWGVDSGLLHFARAFQVPCRSFWGPTHPETRLRPIAGLEESVEYRKIPCSPCVHVAEQPPCRGRNVCIDALFDRETRADGFVAMDPG